MTERTNHRPVDFAQRRYAEAHQRLRTANPAEQAAIIDEFRSEAMSAAVGEAAAAIDFLLDRSERGFHSRKEAADVGFDTQGRRSD